MEVIKGRQNAERAVKNYEESQSPADRHEGWRYFFERTDLKAGMDPAEATHRRQTELETRESKAQEDPNLPITRPEIDGGLKP